MTEPLLEVHDLDVRYGPSQALFGVSIDVAPGTVLAVLGVNGAGKSTLARAISGLVAPTAGRVTFDGQDITGLPAHRIRRLGLTYIPEGRGIFPGLSVIENLRMAVAQERRSRPAPRPSSGRVERFPVLGKRSSQRAGSLSGGEQQMLALARALAVSPKLVIADEMSLGLAPLMAESVFEGLEEARRSGITIVLIEQFVHRALSMADSCVILTRRPGGLVRARLRGRPGGHRPVPGRSGARDRPIRRSLGYSTERSVQIRSGRPDRDLGEGTSTVQHFAIRSPTRSVTPI